MSEGIKTHTAEGGLSMSFNTLNIAVTGLNANQKAMEVTAHNLANVNTDGYSRQRAELVTTKPRMGVIGRIGREAGHAAVSRNFTSASPSRWGVHPRGNGTTRRRGSAVG